MKKQRIILFYIVFAIVIAVVFGRAYRYDYIEFDDDRYIFDNPIVMRGLTVEGTIWSFTTAHQGNWAPLSWLSHMTDVALFGSNPAGHHLTSVMLHILNSILVLLVLQMFTGSYYKSAFVAALFALHPLRVESVVWIAERKDVLSAFFWLIALLAYRRYVKLQTISGYCFVILFFLFGLLSKPMTVTLPFILLLLDIWPLRRVSNTAKKQPGLVDIVKSHQFLRLVIEKVPMIALAAIIGITTFYFQRQGGAVSDFIECPVGVRIENAFVSYGMYIVKTLWPSNLGILYPHPGDYLPSGKVVAAALFFAIATVFALRSFRKRPYLAVGWMWYVISLLPVIGLIQFGAHAMADRFTYLPSIGLFMAAVWGISDMTPGYAFGRTLAVGTGCALLSAYTTVTWIQMRYWNDTETLFRRTLAVTSNNHLIHNNIGCVLSKKGEKKEALYHFQEAVSIKPDYIDARLNCARLMSELEMNADALRLLSDTADMAPDNAKVQDSLGIELAMQGRSAEASEKFRLAIELDPALTDAYNNLGVELENAGKYDEALVHYRKALETNPESVETLNNIGNVFLRSRHYIEAEKYYTKVIALDPDYYRAHFNLGILCAARGENEAAIGHYREALRINPSLAEACNEIATVLASEGKLYEAAAQLRAALRIRPDYEDASNNLNILLNALQR